MRVLIADKFEQSGLDGLAAAGCEVTYQPGLKDQALAEEVELSRPDALVVRSTKVTEAILSAGALKLVVRAGAGYNTIDVAAASRRGIYVSNCPGKNSAAVAELAFALILALDRRIPDNVIALRAGQWNKTEYSKARGLLGRTLGLIGVGQIGREMIPRARGFGLHVAAWSRSLTLQIAKDLGVDYKSAPEEIAAGSDIVSVHVALNPRTRGLIDANFFGYMRPGAYFINTSRAEVVDQAALSRAVREKGIRAGLDVFASEPSRRHERIFGRHREIGSGLRDPPHRRLYRSGSGSHCGRNRSDREDVQRDRQSPERRKPCQGHARDMRDGGAAPGSAGGAGERAGCDQRGPHQCARDGEHRVRGRRGGRGANQPGDRARPGAGGSDQEIQFEHSRDWPDPPKLTLEPVVKRLRGFY